MLECVGTHHIYLPLFTVMSVRLLPCIFESSVLIAFDFFVIEMKYFILKYVTYDIDVIIRETDAIIHRKKRLRRNSISDK